MPMLDLTPRKEDLDPIEIASRDEIAAIVRNGFHASLMTEPEKSKALAEIDRVLATTA